MESDIESIVNAQYDQYPYPQRNPRDERKELQFTIMDNLDVVNSIGFRGYADFDEFVVLIAGGGTGDGTIYLAEQLRNFPKAKIVYCDLSEASMGIAKKRAEERKLTNITWINKSLFDLYDYAERFDYINCCGVLHHLEDPTAGLNCLRQLLKPDGVMSIMLYAKAGRAAVYQMQDLIKKLANSNSDLKAKIDLTKSVVENLPKFNLWHHAKEFIIDFDQGGDAGIVDLFLHSQDRAYTIPELYDFIMKANLHLIDFAMPQRYWLLPEAYGISGQLLDIINSKPVKDQQAIIELYSGKIIKHVVYLSKDTNIDTRADYKDLDNVPFMNKSVGVEYKTTIQSGKFTSAIIENIDGIKTLSEIYSIVKDIFCDEEDFNEIDRDFETIYNALSKYDALLLKNKNCQSVRKPKEIQQFINRMYS